MPYLIFVIAGISLISYIFALLIKKTNLKIIGFSIGLLLFVLSIVLTLIYYYPIFDKGYFDEGIKTFIWFTGLTALLTIIFIPIRFFIKIPDYIFRKILHITAISMMSILIIIPTQWWISEIILGIITVGIITVLLIFESLKYYQDLFIEKGKHEILLSILMFFVLSAVLIAFFFGYRGNEHKYYVIIALLSWGLGDAAASVFGHLLGKHKVSGKFIEGIKSIEGSVACFLFAFVISLILLIVLMHYILWLALLESILIGVVVSLSELFTKKGMDNLTCPIAASIILFLFSLI